MSNTTLGNEMYLAVQHFNLTLRDLEKITINAMKSAFVHYDARIQLIYDTLKPQFADIRSEIAPFE
jgi:adenosine deaminase